MEEGGDHPVVLGSFSLNDQTAALDHSTESFLEITVNDANGELVWEDITNENYCIAFQILGHLKTDATGKGMIIAELPLTSNTGEKHTILVSD